MAEANIDPGGGGTVNSLCMISPSDEVGIVGNLISRIEELEKVVSQLMGANTTADQLSDLSQQVGWVYDVTFMGVPGWTQTEAGTLIPPAGFSLSNIGFTLSDGNTYQGVSFDSDGVLQLGFTTSGQVEGNSLSGKSYIFMNTITCSPGNDIDWGAVSVVRGSAIDWDSGDPTTITINNTGLYIFSLVINGTTSAANGTLQRFIVSVPSGWPFTFTVNELVGTVRSGNFSIGNSLIFLATAPTTLRISWNGADDPSGNISQGTLAVAKIG